MWLERIEINLLWCTVNNSYHKFNSHFLSPGQSLCRQFQPNRNSSSDHKILLKNLYNYARENLALVNIYIKEPVVTRILRDQRIPVIWFVANCGGILGLCMGECKTFWKIETANALFWMYLGGTAQNIYIFLGTKLFCFSR